jgi:hypothetical protein
MNLQEREQLNLFLQQLVQAQAGQKDAEADTLIREACVRQPDAGYLLVQRAMQLEHVLKSTNAQCSQLQAEVDALRSGNRGGFLNDPNAWGNAAATATPAGSANLAHAQRPVPAAAPVAPAPSSWGSGMLGTVATTAAGVVAGSFLFQGINNLMGHHNPSGAAGSNPASNTASPVADNSVIDNYFDDKKSEGSSNLADAGNDFGGDDAA